MTEPDWPELINYLTMVYGTDRAMESATANSVAAKTATTHSVAALVDDVIPRAQQVVGHRWETNQWTVAQEHAATNAARRLLQSIPDRLPAKPSKRHSVLVACADGEWHALAAESLALVLELEGYDVHLAQAATQPSQLPGLIHDGGHRTVLVTCTMSANLAGARRMVDAGLDTGTPVGVGGAAFGAHDGLALRLGATAWASTTSEAPGLVSRLRGRERAVREHRYEPERAAFDPANHDVVACLSARLLRNTANDWEAATAGTWLLRSLNSALACDEPAILEHHVEWQRRRDPELLAHALEAIIDCIPQRATRAASWLTRVGASTD